jgi:hypothetical protein
MGAGFALVLTIRWLQEFFQLELEGARGPWIAAAIAVAAAAVLEVVWWMLSRLGNGAAAPSAEAD